MSFKKASKSLAIILTIVAVALATLTYAAINVTSNVSSSGTITTSPNIAVYSDSACTIPLASISWGTLSPGGSTSQIIYVKNTGTASMTLSMSTGSWNPAGASSYITISWDKQGSEVSAGGSAAATITATVASDITGISSFSNTITITGTG